MPPMPARFFAVAGLPTVPTVPELPVEKATYMSGWFHTNWSLCIAFRS